MGPESSPKPPNLSYTAYTVRENMAHFVAQLLGALNKNGILNKQTELGKNSGYWFQ
jgi:hypothetical protein